ncbi:MAG: TIGR04255 family protein [Planctomycetes bacterium]|nr:TIGR04255 family protein [Planctomycetota bacterium]
MTEIRNPLVDPAPKEIPLPRAPLARVVAQVRFPVVASVAREDFIGPFQEAIRAEYPVLRPETGPAIIAGPGGLTPGVRTVWRFLEVDGAWRATLAPDFVAIETTKYTSRGDLLGRLGRVLEATEKYVGPKVVDRLGLRYIDRLEEAALNEIPYLVRSEMIGVLGTPWGSEADHSICESAFNLPDGSRLQAKWGVLPKGKTVDPSSIEPLDSRTWILDLDLFSEKPARFSAGTLVEQTKRFAERIYTVFRWAATPAFIRRYGGEPE